MNVLFWFFLVGFFVASMQDLKRREVDNWLNLLLFFSGFIFIIFKSFLYNELGYLVNFGFLVFSMFFISYLFYSLRIFSGGDCKLLFASTPLLVSVSFIDSFYSILLFCLLILFVGAVYGCFWILGLFIFNFNKVRSDFMSSLSNKRVYFYLFFILFIVGLFFREILFFSFLFLFVLFMFILGVLLEKKLMVKETKTTNLREGDWLDSDLRLKGRTIRSSFEGLSLEEISFIQKNKKSVKIKDGIPFAPVFFFSWILFYFRGAVMEFLVSILGF